MPFLVALTPHTVELILALGALPPRGGPVQEPVLTVVPTETQPVGGSHMAAVLVAVKVFLRM